MPNNNNNNSMKWFITIIVSIIFILSTLYRVRSGQDADKILSWVFIMIAGLIWGANFINYFIKK